MARPIPTIDFDALQSEARPLIAAANPEASADLVDYAAMIAALYGDRRWRSFLGNLGNDHHDAKVRDRAIKAHTVLARYELALGHRVAA